MLQLLLMTATLLIAPAASAQTETPRGESAITGALPGTPLTTAKPDEQLVRLDQSLTRARDDRSNGRTREKATRHSWSDFAPIFPG